jgi:hypothetical protein
MNASYEVREGYLYVKAMGEFNFLSARDLISEWMETARSHSLDRTLCDVTLVTGLDNQKMSILTRFKISELVANVLPQDFRMAILVTRQQFPDALFGEDVMINKGANVKLTSDLDGALKWLNVASTGTSGELTDKGL